MKLRTMAAVLAFFLTGSCNKGTIPAVPDGMENAVIPLAIGNSWTLKSVSGKNVYKGTIVILVVGDTVLYGKTYRVLEEKWEICQAPYYRFVRVDASGRIFYAENSAREIMLDTKKQNNETYEIGMYTVTVTTPDTLTTPAGTIPKCIDFYIDCPQMCDEESGYTFSKEIGFVRLHGAWGMDYRLLSYTIQ